MGFSLLEVMVALGVLTIGLMSALAVIANIYRYSVASRYMALAAQLASEKLEDLNRWPASPTYTDPNITVPSGNTCGITLPAGESCIGSLQQDYPPQAINNVTVGYFDNVFLTTNQTSILSETYSSPNPCPLPSAGTGNYQQLIFTANGQVAPPTCLQSPPAGMTFDRRWVIELNPVISGQAVAGIRRVTVLVILEDLGVQIATQSGANQQPPPAVTFQMSMVRP